MNNFSIYTIIILMVFALSAKAQHLEHFYQGYSGEFYTDHFDNLYLFEQNSLLKYDAEGKQRYTYDPGYRFKPSVVDVSNPLEIYLLYQGLNRVVVLDNTLSVIAGYSASDAGFLDVWQICRSSSEGFWILDGAELKLRKLDAKLETRAQSDFINRYTGKKIEPSQLLEENRKLFLNNPSDGILVFDIYGNYLQTLNIKGVNRFQVKDEYLYFFREGKFFEWHLNTSRQAELSLPAGLKGEVKDVQIRNKKLYVIDEEGLKIFSY